MMRRMVGKTALGMTLIETVVVTGICAILASLMLGAASRARMVARQTKCANNLRQIGTAYTVSLTASNGALSDGYYSFEGHDGRYDVALRGLDGELARDLFGDSPGNGSVMRCPSDDSPIGCTDSNGKLSVSYAYNVALPLLFRNVSRVRSALDTVVFYDGDASAVAGEWEHTMGWAEPTVRPRHGGKANYLFLDGHVETTASFPGIAFESGPQWLASARDTRPRAVEPVEPIAFDIDSGRVIPSEACNARIICLGAAFQYGAGGPRIPVAAYCRVDGTQTKITDDVHGGEVAELGERSPGDSIVLRGRTTDYISADYRSDDASGHVWLLRDGDIVPSIAGFAGQRSIEDYLDSYIDEDGNVTIGVNDVIVLFELSNDIDYTRFSHADFQDLVLLVTFEK